MANVSKKIHNYNYAPGIATYGVVGLTGDSGANGNTMFYTNYNLESDGFAAFAAAIYDQKVPVSNIDQAISRQYLNGDYFFDVNGIIYKLIDVDSLIAAFDNGDGEQIANYENYLLKVGKIDVDDTSWFRLIDDGNTKYKRVEINPNYAGFDIDLIADGKDHVDYINDDAVMNIVSDDLDDLNDVRLILMTAVNQYNIVDGQLLIYYDTNTNSFHIGTNGTPFVIDAETKVYNTTVGEDIDGYSTVLTSDDPITRFKTICEQCYHSVVASTDVESSSLVNLLISTDSTNNTIYRAFKDSYKKMFVKVYLENTLFMYSLEDRELSSYTYNGVSYPTVIIPLHEYIEFLSDVDDTTKTLEATNPKIQAISLVNNTEIFVKPILTII